MYCYLLYINLEFLEYPPINRPNKVCGLLKSISVKFYHRIFKYIFLMPYKGPLNMPKKPSLRLPKKNSQSPLQKIEKEWQDAPSKIVAYLNQETILLKKKQAKIKNAINKLSSKLNQSAQQLKVADKSKNKQKLKQAKSNHAELTKLHKALNNDVEQLNKLIQITTKKQAKIIALKKYLIQFEKEWIKNSKKIEKIASPKKKTATKKKLSPQASSSQEEVIRVNESYDSNFAQAKVDDQSQINS